MSLVVVAAAVALIAGEVVLSVMAVTDFVGLASGDVLLFSVVWTGVGGSTYIGGGGADGDVSSSARSGAGSGDCDDGRSRRITVPLGLLVTISFLGVKMVVMRGEGANKRSAASS